LRSFSLLTAEGLKIDNAFAAIFPDSTEVSCCIGDEETTFTAKGVLDAVIETAQQVAWLGAALRSEPFKDGVGTCSVDMQKIWTEGNMSKDEEDRPIRLVSSFEFPVRLIKTPETRRESGECWLDMFRNPVLVTGFPILTREDGVPGLEIPLNMAASLVGSQYIRTFDGRLFIKGFSAMLVATKVTDTIVHWHYHFNKGGQRVSYLEAASDDTSNNSHLEGLETLD
jgi:hypothetical protein